jgi:tRNA A37 threonylcarbamoyladenosine dehydratase
MRQNLNNPLAAFDTMFAGQDPNELLAKATFERGYGYQDVELKKAEMATRVIVGGAGGGGGLLAQMLAKKGYEVISADPEDMSDTNRGRMIHANDDTIGVNKAQVVKNVTEKDDTVHPVKVYTDGVTKDNVEDMFRAGLHEGQLVIAYDGIEFRYQHIARMFAQEAKKRGAPFMTGTDIGYGGLLTVIHPYAKRYTYDRVNRVPKHIQELSKSNEPHSEELEKFESPLDTLAYVPPYGSIDTLMSVQNGADLPSTPESVLIATALCMREIQNIVANAAGIRGYKTPSWAPKSKWIDADGIAGSTRFPRTSFYGHLAVAAFRDKVAKINPQASYDVRDIAAREEQRVLAAASRNVLL